MRSVRRASSLLAVSALGTLLVIAGTVMLVTPGPGLLAIFAGLAVWSREFRWAGGLLDRARRRVAGAAGRRAPHPVALDTPAPHGDAPACRCAA